VGKIIDFKPKTKLDQEKPEETKPDEEKTSSEEYFKLVQEENRKRKAKREEMRKAQNAKVKRDCRIE
jgi:hypothetical protein